MLADRPGIRSDVADSTRAGKVLRARFTTQWFEQYFVHQEERESSQVGFRKGGPAKAYCAFHHEIAKHQRERLRRPDEECGPADRVIRNLVAQFSDPSLADGVIHQVAH